MFRQVPALERGEDGGLGIGLTLSKLLVEMHDSGSHEGENLGSEFSIRIPIRDSAETQVRKAARPKTSPVRRVLAVDDNLAAAESLSLLMQLKGFEVQKARDGLEA